jgi:hypothetical protein
LKSLLGDNLLSRILPNYFFFSISFDDLITFILDFLFETFARMDATNPPQSNPADSQPSANSLAQPQNLPGSVLPSQEESKHSSQTVHYSGQ